jgi:glycosyltransferase involved in cell wall biosynthesis
MSHLAKPKLIRTATVGVSLDLLLKGQLKFLNQHFEVVAVSGGGDHLRKVYDREGVRVAEVAMHRKISVFHDIASLLSLYRTFKTEKPDIVHSITPKAGLLSMLAAKMAGVPIRAHTFTGLIFPYKKGILQQLLIWMDRVTCICATSIYPEGNGVKQDLMRYKITSKPLKILANGNVNGVDMDYFNATSVEPNHITAAKQECQIKTEDTVFLFIGRLVKDKGVVELVKAFVELSEGDKKCKLILVGPLESELDPLPADISTLIEIHPRIVWVGFKIDVRPYIVIADVLTFPSYREGFPNVPLQCGAFKKAMILSDVCGCNEIVTHQKSGLLVPTRSVGELVKAMRELSANPSLRDKYGNNVYDFIHLNFQQEEVWKAIENEYKEQIVLSTKINA